MIPQNEQDRQCPYKRNNEGGACNQSCCGKSVSVSYFQCVYVALDIQHAKRMRRITYLLPVCSIKLFSHYFKKDTVSKKKLLEIKCMFRFSLQPMPQISHSKKK